jgi:hypothetical protein
VLREDIINFNRLRKSRIPNDFVKKHKGKWGHNEWTYFCNYITELGYTPIDLDKVGLHLETLKESCIEHS